MFDVDNANENSCSVVESFDSIAESLNLDCDLGNCSRRGTVKLSLVGDPKCLCATQT